MANITDIAPLTEWEQHIADKLVKVNTNASGRIAVYNYNTQIVQFEKRWDAITEASRGLIVDTATGEILARPFRKFFGWTEYSPEAKAAFLARTEPVLVTDKLDGSLGILYTDPEDGQNKIATRGSLLGEHAVRATEMYQRDYDGKWTPEPGYTYLFEILMPGAGIVITYPKDEMVLIGKIDNATGKSVPVNTVSEWLFTVTEVMPYANLQEVLEAPARKFKEGVVVHFLESDDRVKVKYDEFIRLHRIGSGISRYRVWEAVSNGVNPDEWKPFLEEEFYGFVDATAREFTDKYNAILAEYNAAYDAMKARFGDTYDRKEFAKAANTEHNKNVAQFILGREFKPSDAQGTVYAKLWELVKPAKDFK